MKNKHRKKKVLMAITCLLIIIECTTVFLMYKSLNNKDAILEEVKLVNGSNNSGMFAIMLENENGEYEPSENNTWPTNGYTFNSERSGCMDSNGNEVSGALEYTNGVARIKTNKKVSCYMYFDVKLEAFAIYSETDKSLRFYKNNDEVEVGDTYNDLVVTAMYTGIENSEYTPTSVPWEDYVYNITNVVVEEEISPISTVGWFSLLYETNFDLTKLNTSKVTDMQSMFEDCGNIPDIITNWDVSNVTDMERMFFGASNIPDISSWNTSNVTNMEAMFYYAYDIPDISGWDVSNVTTMNYMFYYATTGYTATSPLDLSGWDVSNVTYYEGFIGNISPESSIIAPNFAS